VAEHTFRNLITEIVEGAVAKPTDENVRAAMAVVRLTKKLGLDHNLYLAQEAVYTAAENSADFDKLVELSELLNLRTDLLIDRNIQVRKALHAEEPEMS